MKLFTFSTLLAIRNTIANNTNYLLLVLMIIILSFSIMYDVTAGSESSKHYLRIEKSKEKEDDDLKLQSIGMLSFQEQFMGFVDLKHLQSRTNGNGVTVDFGGGYVFNWDISLYLSFGISLGYNKDNEDYLTSYYPEAGVVVDLTNRFGIALSTKRYHHLYEQNENIIMMGLVFRN